MQRDRMLRREELFIVQFQPWPLTLPSAEPRSTAYRLLPRGWLRRARGVAAWLSRDFNRPAQKKARVVSALCRACALPDHPTTERESAIVAKPTSNTRA